MKGTFFAATALIVTSFTPAAPLATVSGAASLPNVLLCTDDRLLGSSQSGQFWGNPIILPTKTVTVTTFAGPVGSGDTEHFVATSKISREPILQRCPVMNGSSQPTGKYQDVQLAPGGEEIRTAECQMTLTTAGVALGYRLCNALDLFGGSPDDR